MCLQGYTFVKIVAKNQKNNIRNLVYLRKSKNTDADYNYP